MGKASLWFGGAAMIMLGLYYAASAVPGIPPLTPIILFVVFAVFAGLFILTGAIYLFQFGRRRLYPLNIQDDNAHCAYLATEKELQLNWVTCDYSTSSTFCIQCSAHFGEQSVNVGIRALVATRDPKAECVNGTRWVIEGFAQNAEVQAPEKCLLEIKMKPYGRFWAWTKKTLEVETLVIRH